MRFLYTDSVCSVFANIRYSSIFFRIRKISVAVVELLSQGILFIVNTLFKDKIFCRLTFQFSK